MGCQKITFLKKSIKNIELLANLKVSEANMFWKLIPPSVSDLFLALQIAVDRTEDIFVVSDAPCEIQIAPAPEPGLGLICFCLPRTEIDSV